MEIYKASKKGLKDFLSRLGDARSLYLPVEADDRFTFAPAPESGTEELKFNPIRVTDSPKSFFFPPKEPVALWPEGGLALEDRRLAIFGLKSCDITALGLLDKVLKESEIEDPFYSVRRENSLVISSDCTSVGENCFCNLVGGGPYPTEGYDLNISPIEVSGTRTYLVEVGSGAGSELIEENSSLFKEASEELVSKRDEQREEISKELAGKNPDIELGSGLGVLEAESDLWREEAEDCVECGACNLVCPTCHCFQLYESEGEEGSSRSRVWDGCTFRGYARVAGGANPRESLDSRVRNRYFCKFDRFRENHESVGCVGCGRCIEACMGGLDMRDVLEEASKCKTP